MTASKFGWRLSTLAAVAMLIAAALSPSLIRAFQPARPTLLSTTKASAELRRLARGLAEGRATGWDSRSFDRIKATIEDFTLRQLRAAPMIERDDLRNQMAKLYRNLGYGAETYDMVTPTVIGKLAGPLPFTKLWTLAYLVANGAHGEGTSQIVVDCYGSSKSHTRLIGRRDADFSGYFPDKRVAINANSPSSVVLVSGPQTGSNGYGNWRAAIYQCSAKALRLVWQSPTLHALRITTDGDFIALRYIAPDDYLGAGGVAAWTYEIYEIPSVENDGPLEVKLVTRVRQPQ